MPEMIIVYKFIVFPCIILLLQFAADFSEKTMFKLFMKRLLRASVDGDEEDLSLVLSEEILNVDDELLKIEKDTHEVSGQNLLPLCMCSTML